MLLLIRFNVSVVQPKYRSTRVILIIGGTFLKVTPVFYSTLTESATPLDLKQKKTLVQYRAPAGGLQPSMGFRVA